MNPWWPRLYTLPALKRLIWPFSTWFVANLLCMIFFPKIREITYLVAIYPWFVFLNDNEYTLANNLDFHRVHCSYGELRRAIFLDLFAQVLFFLGAFYLLGAVLWPGAERGELFDYFGTPSMAFLLGLSFLMFLVAPKLGLVKQMQAHRVKHCALKEKKIEYLLFAFLGLLAIYLLMSGKSFYLIGYVFVSAICLATLIEWYLESFHIRPALRSAFRVLGLPLTVMFFISLTTGISFLAKKEIIDGSLPAQQRLQTFLMFQDFGIILAPHTASEFVASAFAYDAFDDIFEHSGPGFFDLEVEKAIRYPDYRAYYFYLKTGKAPRHNLEYLYQKTLSEGTPWKNQHYYERYRETLIRHFPEARSLPARSIASKKRMGK